MAFAIIAGIAAAMPAVIAATSWAAFSWGAFALGAGLSMLSRALMPSLDMSSMQGSTLNVREPSAPRKIVYGRTRVGGAIVFLDTSGDDNKFIHLVIAVAGHEIEAFEKVFFGDRLVWSNGAYQGVWADYAELNFHKGDQTTADANLVSRSSKWDSANKLLDTAYVYVRLEYDAEEYAAGLPNVSFQVKGKKVYNPVSGLTEWTENPALCVRDYLVDTKYGLGEQASRINQNYLSNAITVCDQNVTLANGSTEKRFTLNGVIDTSASRKSIINAMLTAMGGKLVYSGDEYFISPAYYQTPTVAIDESVMVGDIQVNTKQSRRQLFNGVKGSFVSKEQNYIVADYPAQISSTYATADGDPIYLDMSLPFTVTNTAAQRLAKIGLLSSRQQTTATLPCNLAALQFKAGDVINVTNAKMGWSNKAFEVLNYTLSPDSDGRISVNVNVIETAAALYDWATSDEEDFLQGGEIDLYDGQTVPVPASLNATTATHINEDGTAVESLIIAWGASPDVFVERYEVEWATQSAPYETAVTDGLRFEVKPVIAATTYYCRVRAVNNLGVKSAYVTANVTASGDETAPAAAASLTATPQANSVVLTWTNPSDADFSHMTVRQKQSGGSWATVASVSGGKNEFETFTVGNVVGGTTYYYAIRSVDYSGNVSAYVYSASVVPLSPETRAPRNSHDYVYFKTASANQPSLPTATSYDFDDNVLGGLTSTWQQEPLTVTGGDGKYWAAAFVVTENAYDGTETIAFSAPFSSYNFDGLVTFTNLNNALSQGSTTIDGGLIKTGTVAASRLAIDGVGLDTQLIGGVQTLVIGGGGVTNANIATNTITASRIAANAINNSEINTGAVQTYNLVDSVITPVKIEDLAVTEGKIANLAVDTIKIKNQAVTIPSSVEQSSDVFLTGTSEYDILSLTWASTGAETEVLWGVTAIISFNQTQNIALNIKLNGTLMQAWGVSETDRLINFINVNPNSGNNTLKITARANFGYSGSLRPIIFASAIRTLELKK